MPIDAQLGTDATPVVLVHAFTMDPAEAEALLAAWEHDANRMERQPGCIPTQLHRATGGSSLFLDDAVWGSVAHFRAAFTHPAFRSALHACPSSAATPFLQGGGAEPLHLLTVHGGRRVGACGGERFR